MITAELLDEARERIRLRVAISDDDVAELVDDVMCVVDGPDELDGSGKSVSAAWATAVAGIAAEELAAHQAAQAGWPHVTDCDRLDAAFQELDAAGVVARQDFSCCTSCGHAEIGELASDRTDAWGYAFYHEQDTESVVEGGQLLVAYGAFRVPADTPADRARGAAVGDEVARSLRRQGLAVRWDGDTAQRIAVTVTWQRRRR